ncbi:MAG: histidinol dehydrogenase [Magnetococcales bacterium]|nr:histidinol dehydrogenase [Magnetococcales bacterium]
MSRTSVRRLDSKSSCFYDDFDRLLRWESGEMSVVEQTVADIIATVRQTGDQALIEYTRRFDRVDLTPATLAFSRVEIDRIANQTTSGERAALELAAERIQAYHRWQMPEMGVHSFRDATGTLLGQRLTPLQRVGVYVPGGLATYPSTVLMNAIPARVAGVTDLAMVVPTPDGVVNPLLLMAARIAGIEQIFRIGGAQAVAALALGTQTIPSVDKIVGPGNIYVATAKRQLFGQVGIDMLAGPSEILIIADHDNDPSWLAADLLSQAEHDASAQAILMTDSSSLADAVEQALTDHLVILGRRAICERSLAGRGAIILVKDLYEACVLATRVAPEHLELAVADPESLLPHIGSAGAIFLGRHTPEAIGDYVAGPSHVLPTSGTARFSSPLGVFDFIKRTSLMGCTKASLDALAPSASRLAASEGLTAHQLSLDLRRSLVVASHPS